MLNYFNLHHSDYHAKFIDQKWNGPCAENITYHIDQRGSMASYRYLLSRVEEKMLQIVLYNGDWDDVVPYHDTIKGIENLNLVHSYL